jgi:hypothetical protein
MGSSLGTSGIACEWSSGDRGLQDSDFLGHLPGPSYKMPKIGYRSLDQR